MNSGINRNMVKKFAQRLERQRVHQKTLYEKRKAAGLRSVSIWMPQEAAAKAGGKPVGIVYNSGKIVYMHQGDQLWKMASIQVTSIENLEVQEMKNDQQ